AVGDALATLDSAKVTTAIQAAYAKASTLFAAVVKAATTQVAATVAEQRAQQLEAAGDPEADAAAEAAADAKAEADAAAQAAEDAKAADEALAENGTEETVTVEVGDAVEENVDVSTIDATTVEVSATGTRLIGFFVDGPTRTFKVVDYFTDDPEGNVIVAGELPAIELVASESPVSNSAAPSTDDGGVPVLAIGAGVALVGAAGVGGALLLSRRRNSGS
ncbi:MAG: hypothetical protein WBF79_15610, partial [Rhodococcus sp. (in: high G+C Gram-positive bacteria)]